MRFSRRRLLETGALAGASVGLASLAGPGRAAQAQEGPRLPASFQRLKPLGERVQPITTEEFQGRIALAQRLMTETRPQLSAILLTPGSSLRYYTGVRWVGSERLLGMLIPRQGGPLMVCPAFEEGRLREQLRWPVEVRIWQEDESPYALLAGWLAERRIRTGRIGIEESTPYVFFDGLRNAAQAAEYATADPVTIGCRGRKTAHELTLMRLACEATIDVFRAVFASLRQGMTPQEVATLVSQGFAQMSLEGDALVLFGASAALPHGSHKPQTLKEEEIVLIDGGTAVEGYRSDVTRCGMLGKPPERLIRVFEIVRKAQDAALAAAARSHPCGSVDDAARKVITDAGYGPGYKYFTHRLGHGIGLDGHEHPYLVHGNPRPLEPGMTFSNEPGIYVPGEFGLRLEDDMVIQEAGSAQLLTPGFSPPLENPAG